MSTDNTAPSEYRGPAIPRPLGEQLQAAFDLDARPGTFGDWVGAMADLAERDGFDVDVEVLCTTDDSDHAARIEGETRHFQCVLDAMIVPFLVDGIDSVEIDTVDPVSREGISIVASGDGFDVTPAGAVMSFGVARDVDGPPENAPLAAYSLVCPYGNAFVSRAAYREWAADVDAQTMATTMEEAHRLAAALGRVAEGG